MSNHELVTIFREEGNGYQKQRDGAFNTKLLESKINICLRHLIRSWTSSIRLINLKRN